MHIYRKNTCSKRKCVTIMTYIGFARNVNVGFINPVSLIDRFPSKGPAQQTTSQTNAQLLGRPKYLNSRPEGRSNFRSKSLAEEERRPLPTPAHLSGRNARFGLQPATGRSLRPEGLAKHHFRLQPASPTGDAPNLCLQLLSNWRNQSRLGPTDRGRPLGKD